MRSTRRFWFTIAVAFAAYHPLPANAQVPLDSLPSGSRIRVRAPEAGIPFRTTGVFGSVTGSEIIVHGLDHPSVRVDSVVSIPLLRVNWLEISRGRKSRISRAGRGALWGLAVYGAVAGAFIVHEQVTCQSGCFGDGLGLVMLAQLVPWSAGAGAGIGFVLPVETWQRVDLARP